MSVKVQTKARVGLWGDVGIVVIEPRPQRISRGASDFALVIDINSEHQKPLLGAGPKLRLALLDLGRRRDHINAMVLGVILGAIGGQGERTIACAGGLLNDERVELAAATDRNPRHRQQIIATRIRRQKKRPRAGLGVGTSRVALTGHDPT